jgi:MarR family transcriptional regulator, organic hydroperoxide resistance regulator
MSDAQRLDNQLCFALYTASRAMTRAYQPLLEELDITYPQYLVLLVLWEQDGVRVSGLGERLHLDSATLTPLLKRLEARGLIERRRSAVDERVVEVFLTADGKRARRRAQDIPQTMLCKSGLSLAELTRLRAALQEVTRALLEADEAA